MSRVARQYISHLASHLQTNSTIEVRDKNVRFVCPGSKTTVHAIAIEQLTSFERIQLNDSRLSTEI
jgi:hypothetical protein